MTKDLHSKPFDEGTLAKLAIFKGYLKEWLPVFLAARVVRSKHINIFDFFAGPGEDPNQVKGSPLIIVDELSPYADQIKSKQLSVTVWLNEYDVSKYKVLRANVESHRSEALPYKIEVLHKDFPVAFEELYPTMSVPGTANLLFLDQYGVCHITEDVFARITSLQRTDILFFISSSTIRRFADHPAFQK